MNDIQSKKSKELLVGTVIYAIGSFGTKILSFLIVPLYTFYITTIEMGDYDLMLSTISLITPLITLQISDGAYAWMIRNRESNSLYIVTVYRFVLITSILAVIAIALINHFIPIYYVGYFTIILIFGRWMQTLQRLLRGLKNQKLFAISGILYTAVFLTLNVVQIVVLDMGVVALYQSNAISSIIVVITILLFEPRLRVFNIKINTATVQKEMLKFSIPLIPNRLNWWIMSSSNRYIIKFFIDSSANGIFAIAHKFPSLLQMIFSVFFESWQDLSISDKNDDSGKFYTYVFRTYYCFAFSAIIVLIPLTKIAVLIMHESYHFAANFTAFLYIGTVFQALSSFLGVGYLKSNKTKDAASTSVYGAIVNAIVHIILIKYIGLYASAISTMLGFTVMFYIRYYQTKSIMQINVEWLKFYVLLIISIIMSLVCIYTKRIQDYFLIIFGVIVFFMINRSLLYSIMNKFSNKMKKRI